jgi:membrane protease subunit HflC
VEQVSDNNTINLNARMAAKKAGKTVKGIIVTAVLVLVALIVLSTFTFIVNEHQQTVVTRFGSEIIKIVVDPDIYDGPSEINGIKVVEGKGLFFKLPFIDKVENYDTWLYTYVSDSEKINTADKKQYYITMFAQWRISDPAKFKVTHNNTVKATNYLDTLIFPAIIQNINRLQAQDFISDKAVLNEALKNAQENINNTISVGGIEILDIQVHRTILPDGNLQSTYERMIANRAKEAQKLRADGDKTYQQMVSAADREAREIEASAVEESKKIKGEGEAEALRIYADSYSVDPDFYAFWRSLEALQHSLEKDSTLVLDENHPLWSNLLDWVSTQE